MNEQPYSAESDSQTDELNYAAMNFTLGYFKSLF
jgi:hypothetical protein